MWQLLGRAYICACSGKENGPRHFYCMKLLFIIPSITNYFTFLEELIDELNDRGHEVHLAASRKHIARISEYRREIKCRVHHIDFPRAIDPFRHYAAARSVRALVNSIAPDIINVHFSAALFTSMLARQASWPPTTGTIHGLGSPLIGGWRKRVIAKAERWSAERADEVFVLTEDDRITLGKNAPGATVRVLDSFGMGCDLERFDAAAVSEKVKGELRKNCGIEAGDFVYIFIGRQTHFKGYDKVVTAFAEVLKAEPRSKLLLVGEKDRIHHTSLESKLETTVKNDPAFVKVGWRENVQDYLAISHLNVFPSEREGLPVNLMESLSMGVPVVTVDSRGCRDVVTDGETGVVLSDRSRDALVREMLRLQRDRADLKRLSANAVAARERYDRKKFLESQFTVFERLTGKSI